VAATHYEMKRVGNVNPGILTSSPRTYRLLPLSAITNQCRRGLGYKKKDTLIVANFHDFNHHCGGVDMNVFVDAAYGHEGFGYSGGVGHESLARTAAAEPQNDPYVAIEQLVFPDPLSLATEVVRRVDPINQDITLRASDSTATNPNPNGGPKNNYPSGGHIWYWDPSANDWIQYPVIKGF
jgi:hypothetical protein